MSDLSTLVAATPEIRPKEFIALRDYVYKTFGLELRDGKERLVTARLGKHMRTGGFRTFEQYIRHVQSDSTGDSLVSLIDALTTNHTHFMREPEHFKFLLTNILPQMRRRPSFTIWSAASSTGEEPYSILFSLLDALGGASVPDVRIVATDISTRVLSAAREGIYTAERVRLLPPAWLQKFFTPTDKRKENFQVRPEFRSKVEFRRLNLMEPLPASMRHPVIFCRNVMIYFNKQTQAALVRRLAGVLEPEGHLMVGHSESLTGLDQPLKYICPAVYRKTT